MTSIDILVALSCDMSGISRLPRLLGRHGIRTTVLTSPDFLLSRSSTVYARIAAPAGAEATARTLEEHLRTGTHNYQMVILGDDQLNQCVAENYSTGELAKYLPCPSNLRMNWSKAVFIDACRQNGLAIPDTVIGTTLSEAEDAALAFDFPVIFKEAAGCSGEYVYCFESIEQIRTYMQARPIDGTWLIQEPLKGQNVTVDVLFNHGRVEAWASSIVERTCNGPFSSSTARRFVPMPELEGYISDIGQLSRAHGFCGIDFILQEDGSLAIIEMNCRPTTGHSLSLNAGIDFATALTSMLKGEEPPAQHQRATTIIPTFPEDVGRCIGERDIAGLVGWLLRPSRWRLLPWAEPRIFVKNLLDLAERVTIGIWNHITHPFGYSK